MKKGTGSEPKGFCARGNRATRGACTLFQRAAEPDARTLSRLQAGDIAALAPIYESCGLRVHRLCRRLLGSANDADDATQEVFLRVFERAASFDGRSRFSTWLYRLAVHHCLNRLRERSRRDARRRLAARRAASTEAPGDRLNADETSDQVDRLLAELPPHYRACVVLREIDGLSYADIADLLDIPRGTVMSRLARARLLLAARAGKPPRRDFVE